MVDRGRNTDKDHADAPVALRPADQRGNHGETQLVPQAHPTNVQHQSDRFFRQLLEPDSEQSVGVLQAEPPTNLDQSDRLGPIDPDRQRIARHGRPGHRGAYRIHVVRPPPQTGSAGDSPATSALAIDLGDQYDTEVTLGPEDPLTARQRTETPECPQPCQGVVSARVEPASPDVHSSDIRPAHADIRFARSGFTLPPRLLAAPHRHPQTSPLAPPSGLIMACHGRR